VRLALVALREEHLEEAAALAGHRYRGLRERVELLPARYGDSRILLPLLREVVGAGPAVAAVREGRLVGFLAGWLLPSFRGSRAAFSPEWANGAVADDARRIYEEMYTHLSAAWVDKGTYTHLISTLANDSCCLSVFHWLGFGMIAADAVRGLEPVAGVTGDGRIHRGGLDDIEAAMALSEALERHMASAPTFLAHDEPRDRQHYESWLADPANALWLACEGAEAVAFMTLGPASMDACTIIQDNKTASIVAAFASESVRGQGVSAALLNRALEWARGEGYERCAVDFEPMNPWAAHFWLKHFRPVAYTLVRYVDRWGENH